MSLQPTLSLIMLFVTYVLTTDEWQRIYQAAIKQWPAETNLISRQEVMRRFAEISDFSEGTG